MNTFRKLSFWYSVLILVVLFIVILISLTYSGKERLAPLIAGISGAVLTVLVLIGEKYPELTKRFDFSLTQLAFEGLETKAGQTESRNNQLQGALRFLAWMGWAMLLIFFIGFHIAIPVFVFTFLKIFGRLSWLRSLVSAVVSAFVLIGLFEVVLKVGLFKGILLGELIPPL